MPELDEETEVEERRVSMSREDIRALEDRAKANAKLERENVLLRLGVNLDSAGGKLLIDNPNLPWDKVDSIKEIALGVGAIKVAEEPIAPPIETALNTPDPVETEQQRLRSGLAAGGKPDDGPPQEDPYQAAIKAREKTIDSGGSEVAGLADAVGTLFNAGIGGDQRVVYNPLNPRQHYPEVEG